MCRSQRKYHIHGSGERAYIITENGGVNHLSRVMHVVSSLTVCFNKNLRDDGTGAGAPLRFPLSRTCCILVAIFTSPNTESLHLLLFLSFILLVHSGGIPLHRGVMLSPSQCSMSNIRRRLIPRVRSGKNKLRIS